MWKASAPRTGHQGRQGIKKGPHKGTFASPAMGDRAPSVTFPCSLPAGTEHSPERRHPEDAGGPAGQRGHRAWGGLPRCGRGGQAGGGAGGAGAACPAITAGPQGPLQKLLLENLHLLLVPPGLAPPGRPPTNTLPSLGCPVPQAPFLFFSNPENKAWRLGDSSLPLCAPPGRGGAGPAAPGKAGGPGCGEPLKAAAILWGSHGGWRPFWKRASQRRGAEGVWWGCGGDMRLSPLPGGAPRWEPGVQPPLKVLKLPPRPLRDQVGVRVPSLPGWVGEVRPRHWAAGLVPHEDGPLC